MNFEPECSSEGLFIVKHETTFLHWFAWKTWLNGELKKAFSPPVMTVLHQFPPETDGQAQSVAAWYNAMRARIKWGQRVPENPRPWHRWTPGEMDYLEGVERTRRAGGYYPAKVTHGALRPREGFYRSTVEDHQRDAYEQERMRSGQPSRLDADEVETRRYLVADLVQAGMAHEDARVKVMIERTSLLYPEYRL